MPQHIKFPSIEQFRHAVQDVQRISSYAEETPPVLKFTGTVKLHGTNHSVCVDSNNVLYTQSRTRITTPEDDNAGSSAWSHLNKDVFVKLFARVRKLCEVQLGTPIQVFGEWCGGNVQGTCGLKFLDKQFIVFGIRLGEEGSGSFIKQELVAGACDGLLTHIYEFPTFEVEVDFNAAGKSSELLESITLQVEKDCPVSRQLLGDDFPHELVGEGIVWSTQYRGKRIQFKTKGNKHRNAKSIASAGVDKVTKVREFVNSVCTPSRLQQGLEHVPERTTENLAKFINWVAEDILKEEYDTIAANFFTEKEVRRNVSKVAARWFLNSTE